MHYKMLHRNSLLTTTLDVRHPRSMITHVKGNDGIHDRTKCTACKLHTQIDAKRMFRKLKLVANVFAYSCVCKETLMAQKICDAHRNDVYDKSRLLNAFGIS